MLGVATVIGADVDRDLALLSVKKPISGYVFVLSPKAPRLGDDVAALGYPLGLPLTLTRGPVSGMNRTQEIDGIRRRSLVQTDAELNHGNSGGPLLLADTGAVVRRPERKRRQRDLLRVFGAVAKGLVAAWRAGAATASARALRYAGR